MFRPRCSESVLERDEVDPGSDLEDSKMGFASAGVGEPSSAADPSPPLLSPGHRFWCLDIRITYAKLKGGLFLFRLSAARVI